MSDDDDVPPMSPTNDNKARAKFQTRLGTAFYPTSGNSSSSSAAAVSSTLNRTQPVDETAAQHQRHLERMFPSRYPVPSPEPVTSATTKTFELDSAGPPKPGNKAAWSKELNPETQELTRELSFHNAEHARESFGLSHQTTRFGNCTSYRKTQHRFRRENNGAAVQSWAKCIDCGTYAVELINCMLSPIQAAQRRDIAAAAWAQNTPAHNWKSYTGAILTKHSFGRDEKEHTPHPNTKCTHCGEEYGMYDVCMA